MFDVSQDAVSLRPLARPVYPERAEALPANRIDEWGGRLIGRVTRAWRASRALPADFVPKVRDHEQSLRGLALDALREQAVQAGRVLRRDGFLPDASARAFAIICAVSERCLGKRPYDVQLQGAWVLLRGMVAEMETGEGKTLTATLPACTAALAGIPVHVITVNDYLVERDAQTMGPIYQALGLSVGVAVEKQQPGERQAAYACDIVYGTNKTIVFDYLRDRITLAGNNSALRLRLEKLGGASSRTARLLLRGLHFAIVDEADSVLADEARTPLIISAPAQGGDQERAASQGIDLALQLAEGTHFRVDRAERRIELTELGRERLGVLCASLGGIWAGTMRREEMIGQALSALHLFSKDEHYLVREGKVEIVDEYTGRTMADRSWERGLHQLVEAKEGCEITAPKEPLARISYQRFFRRYLLLGGMTGTAREVAGELGVVYGLPVVRIPTNRPSRRHTLPDQVFVQESAKWEAITRRIGAIHANGRPVLLGTRSVAASEHASSLLAAAGIDHRLINAKQDKEEAEIIARAGAKGQVTIATNMAGRGTDIELGEGVADLGGLHVILSERHDSNRVDRQLAGRCGRQGDPGQVEPMISLEDGLTANTAPWAVGALKSAVAWLGSSLGPKLGSAGIRLAQKQAERQHSRARTELMKMDQQMGNTLAFTGSNE